jgi:hypothetical protein
MSPTPTPGPSSRTDYLPVEYTAESIMEWAEEVNNISAYVQKLQRRLAEAESRITLILGKNTRLNKRYVGRFIIIQLGFVLTPPNSQG